MKNAAGMEETAAWAVVSAEFLIVLMRNLPTMHVETQSTISFQRIAPWITQNGLVMDIVMFMTTTILFSAIGMEEIVVRTLAQFMQRL